MQIECVHCGDTVIRSGKNPKQAYCGKYECQRKRKTKWEKNKIKTDPDYKANRRDSQQTWKEDNPNYWGEYRKKNPERTKRNKILQKVRYQRQKRKKSENQARDSSKVVAKMDALDVNKSGISGTFWLVPFVAKMDALKVQITDIKDTKPLQAEEFLSL